MTVIEGVDFSRGGIPSAASLRAEGKHFKGRYAVSDKSPDGRGYTASEYKQDVADGFDMFLFWEGQESGMLGGFAAGVAAAQNAQGNIELALMPPTIPVYFACDFDATPEQQAAIDDYLRGCASVIGLPRTKIYGGFWVVSRCIANGTASGSCQTSAWSGGQWFAGNDLEQYGYNLIIDGVNCDAVRALKDNYGQASKFVAQPPHPDPVPEPAPKPKPPTTVPGIKLPKGVTVELLGRLYTGSPNNHITIGGETISFDVNGAVSRAWLKRCLASIPHGKTWREGSWPQIKDRVHRGTGGKDGTDFVFVDGGIIHADAHGHVTG